MSFLRPHRRPWLPRGSRRLISCGASRNVAAGCSIWQHYARQQLMKARLNWENSLGQIISLVLGDPNRTMRAARRLLDGGFFVPGIRPPSVPAGQSMLRISLTTSHCEQQIDDLVAALREAATIIASMPANLTPQYKKAEEEYRRAQSPDEELRCLELMLREIPKHKGTDKLQAELKAKISKASQETEQAKKTGKKGHHGPAYPAAGSRAGDHPWRAQCRQKPASGQADAGDA